MVNGHANSLYSLSFSHLRIEESVPEKGAFRRGHTRITNKTLLDRDNTTDHLNFESGALIKTKLKSWAQSNIQLVGLACAMLPMLLKFARFR